MHRRPTGRTSWLTLATPLVGIDEQPLPIERDDLRSRAASCSRQRRGGSRSCEPIQMMPPRSMIDQRRDRPDDEFELAGKRPSPADRRARVFEARNHQAKPSVARIVGMTIASMMASESSRICASPLPIVPCGSTTMRPQPERLQSASSEAARASPASRFRRALVLSQLTPPSKTASPISHESAPEAIAFFEVSGKLQAFVIPAEINVFSMWLLSRSNNPWHNVVIIRIICYCSTEKPEGSDLKDAELGEGGEELR